MRYILILTDGSNAVLPRAKAQILTEEGFTGLKAGAPT
jgi:hypothetical protein